LDVEDFRFAKFEIWLVNVVYKVEPVVSVASQRNKFVRENEEFCEVFVGVVLYFRLFLFLIDASAHFDFGTLEEFPAFSAPHYKHA
jgi:hypothetical protein